MVGTVVDHFRVVARLGGGGMGTVYKAVDLLLEREVALKFLRPELARQPDLAERFRAEAVILSRLAHPHIASLYSLHRRDAELFMVMEYVPGETLQARLARAGPVPPREAARLAARVLDALDYAHRQGVVHRDIKTANIIVTPHGTPKVMDFGIARVLGSERHTRLGVAVGTPAYMSPEQIQGLDVDGRSDLYSLGVVLYEMLTGRVPFEGDSDWALMQAHVHEPPPPLSGAANLPPGLEQVVMRALEKPRDRRYATALHFKLDLEAVMPGTVADLHRPGASVVAAPTAAAGAPDAAVGGAHRGWRGRGTPVAAGAVRDGRGRQRAGREAGPWRGRFRPAAVVASLAIALLAGWRVWHAGPADPGVPGAGPPRGRRAAASPAPSASETGPGAASRAANPFPHAAGRQSAVAAPPRPAAPGEGDVSGAFAPDRTGLGRAGGGKAGEKGHPIGLREPFDEPAGAASSTGGDRTAPPATQVAGASGGEPAPGPAERDGTRAAGSPAGASSATGVPAGRPETAEAVPEAASKAVPAGRASAPTPTPAVASNPVRAPAASPVSFDRIWLLEPSGDDVREVGVVLELAGDHLAVLDRTTREPRRTLPYHAISDMIYAQSRHPRWKAGAGAAVAVGVFAAPVFFMKNTKHWLTLQGAGDAIVLRLDKNNYRLVLPALEARTGRPVEVVADR
jgi:tRNA A-37 threonylcarbamoyl transferase component Bud32